MLACMTRTEELRPLLLTNDQVNDLRGEIIENIRSVRGRPGGANNDSITVEFQSGKQLNLQIYALYETVAKVKDE